MIRALSTLLFIAGCLIMLCSVLYAWVFLVIQAAEWSAILGWILFIGGMLSFSVYKTVIEKPWQTWFMVWKWADAQLDKRLS